MRNVTLNINGRAKQVVAEPNLVLLDLLRGSLGLTGTKQSCDRKGQCGACTVIVDNKATRSCLAKVADLDGAEVITVEGLGTPDNPHLIQEAFVLSGAIQCGFCTPGMIMAAKALLDRNPDPDEGEIKQALKRNLCRCTGYVKIIKAVKLAGRFIQGETSPDEVRPDPHGPKIGVSHPRPTAMAKACGTADFAADFILPGALELAVVRSPHPHAEIKGLDASAALKMAGVEGVMTAAEIRGTNRLAFFTPDRPLLCRDRVRYIGDPVAIVAARTRAQAEAAAKAIQVDYSPLPILDSPEEALAPGAAQLHPEGLPNLCFRQPQIKGRAEEAFEESAVVVEHEFVTQINHQAPLEPEAAVAWLETEEGEEEPQLVVAGRGINIHHHLSVLQEAVGYENMRYLEAVTGGQFGLALDIAAEGVAAAAALHFGRPVRYLAGLAESMLMTPKRHPFRMKVRLGADGAGKLTAYANDFVVDKGAYYSIGPVIINRSLLMLSNSYDIPNIKAEGRLVYTNNPWGSAARGAGPPQVSFALECAVDMLAHKMGLDALEFRKSNSLTPGRAKSCGQVVDQWPFPELCDLIKPHWERAKKEAAGNGRGPLRRGAGLGTGSFGIAQPGDQAVAAVELDPDGGLSVYAAAADPGEGNDSMLTQLAAEVMGLPLDKIRLRTRDTDLTTSTGPAAGSRMTYMVGGAMIDGLTQLKAAMVETGAGTGPELARAGRPVRYLGRKKHPQTDPLDPQTGQGPGFDSQVHAIQLAELEVDLETGKVRIIKMTTAVDAGTIINPHNLEGQLEGGMDQGVGYALREIYLAGESKDWVTFKFPTVADSFEMEILTRETPRTRGALGATGVGEMTLIPSAPAVINAIHNACGVWVTELPATPDRIKAALAAAG